MKPPPPGWLVAPTFRGLTIAQMIERLEMWRSRYVG